MREIDLIKRLKNKYSPPDYAFLSQVRNQTGYSGSDGIRTVDGLAMGLWGSRGIDLMGFEIKVSRSDFLSELKQPDKSDAIAKFCDYWFIVAPKGMVKIEELPITWGLIEPYGSGLRIKKQGVKLESKPMTRNFLASIFRSLTTGVVLKSEVQAMVREQVKEKIRSKEWEADKRIRECESNEKELRLFEKLVGKSIDLFWGDDFDKYALALKQVVAGNDGKDNLIKLKEKALKIADDIEKVMRKK